MSTNLVARAPARIDLAGGTLDLWPLYLFYDNAVTVNVAIDQYAEVEFEIGASSTSARPASAVRFESQDRGESAAFDSFSDLLQSFGNTHRAGALPPALWLHAKVVRHFFSFWRDSAALSVTTRCAAPAGAGLGGSSALNIALCCAMRELTSAPYTDAQLLDVARDLETTVIDVPAGIQDYWSALFGGVQAIMMEPGRMQRKGWTGRNRFLEEHVVLCYTGHSRNSGINNWAVYKAFIDKHEGIRDAFAQIVKATGMLQVALDRSDIGKFAEAIRAEWRARQSLAPTIATPEMLAIIDRATELGALAAKVCGAGGGGCFIMVAPDLKHKRVISEKLRADGAHLIDFNVVDQGCTVSRQKGKAHAPTNC